ncbi:bifunctional indole-3-glycerol-phosphate synthase TrpC/phosphoribosylanthranilate isomerase TrpF [Aliikangiella maris]|uniref:Multifunctional fusion protein n=2 Tax=Aliikangiella maris TaxID=3162458 RepID=A0ABV2BVP2_9GAMM
MKNVLAEIVQHKVQEVAERKITRPLSEFKSQLEPSARSFFDALSNEQADFILECKKASPSKGLIREDFDLDYILSQYQDYASAVSVLTDKRYFQGDFSYLSKASQVLNVPVLCKDFFIDTYQVYEARSYGADAILLMLSVLDDAQYQTLSEVAQSLNLDVLTEIHDEAELERALALNAKIIGINNRDLKSLTIDLAVTEKLAPKISSDRIIISESGIETHADVKRLSPLVNGFLVGSSIMAQQDIRSHCKALIFGRVKICGLTKVDDAQMVDQCGGYYGGFIFYPKSPRNINLSTAQLITQAAPLNYVGVFVNADIALICNYVEQLNLYAVQLHGEENADYITKLKQQLPNTPIWKAERVGENINFTPHPDITLYLLDAYSPLAQGGTGHQFNWQLLDNLNTQSIILAGGINPENVNEAMAQNTYAIDLSSGVESSPGIKNHALIKRIFDQLHA